MKKIIVTFMVVMALLTGLVYFGADYACYKITEGVVERIKDDGSYKAYKAADIYIVKKGYMDYDIVMEGCVEGFKIKTTTSFLTGEVEGEIDGVRIGD